MTSDLLDNGRTSFPRVNLLLQGRPQSRRVTLIKINHASPDSSSSEDASLRRSTKVDPGTLQCFMKVQEMGLPRSRCFNIQEISVLGSETMSLLSPGTEKRGS